MHAAYADREYLPFFPLPEAISMSGVPGRRSNSVNFGVVVFALLMSAVASYAWQSDADPHDSGAARANAAVEHVMEVYDAQVEKYQKAPRNMSVADYAAALGKVADVLDKQDMSGCPKDFRVACTQNIRALRDAQRVIRRCPRGVVEGVLTGAKNYWLRGENDGGATRLQDEVKAALKRVRETSDAVERVAAKYTE
jgi:hypothetical protein